mgnify:CR=1 FL=1
MGILKDVFYLGINFFVIVVFAASMASIGVKIDSFGTFWKITAVALGVVFTKIALGALLHKIKELIAPLNTFRVTGRKIVIAMGWIVSIWVSFNFISLLWESSSWGIIFPAIFLGNALLVLMVNFCYTQYT